MSDSGGIALYVHVPFCRKKCDYCDFFSVGSDTCADYASLRDDYVSSVLNEVSFSARNYAVSAWDSIYFGGGTPSQLSAAHIERLLQGIAAAAPVAPDAEITLEVNPDDVTEPLLAACARAGVNRISMGVQAFDQRALDSVCRGASASSAWCALERLKACWHGRLSCDLIAGLPRHTAASFEDGVRSLAAFPNVDHISLYTLTVEEGTPLARRIARDEIRWSPEKADRLWLRGRTLLENAGFAQYEVSQFAKDGCQSRHNLTYWQLRDYIGCGAGASGTIYGAASQNGAPCGTGMRWTNTTDIAAYNAFWRQPVPVTCRDLPRQVEALDAPTQEFEYLMMGFRTVQGVSAAAYRARFGKCLAGRIGVRDGAFSRWQSRGLACVRRPADRNDVCYTLSRRGLLLLNRFLEELL